MTAWLVCLLVLAQPAADGAYDRARTHMEEGEFGAAWEALQTVEEPLLVHRGHADLFYWTRDFPASLSAARRGLELAPHDIFLLHRALAAALWLRAVDESRALVGRLERAVADAALSEADRAWWVGTVESLGADARDLARGAARRQAALSRARWTALVLLAGAGLGLAVLASRK